MRISRSVHEPVQKQPMQSFPPRRRLFYRSRHAGGERSIGISSYLRVDYTDPCLGDCPCEVGGPLSPFKDQVIMLFVHKRSLTPIDPWPALKHGGVNNLGDPAIKGQYLVLWNVDIVQREGRWHYLFEFDKRDSLQTGALAKLVGNERGYPNDMDWKAFLGPEYTIITASVRAEILNMPAEAAHTVAVITGTRQVAPTDPSRPIVNPGDWYEMGELPRDFLLALPGGLPLDDSF